MSSQESSQPIEGPSQPPTHAHATTSTQICHSASRSHRLTCVTTHHRSPSPEALSIALTASIVGRQRGRRSNVHRTVPAEVLASSEVMHLVQDYFHKNRAALRVDTVELTTTGHPNILTLHQHRPENAESTPSSVAPVAPTHIDLHLQWRGLTNAAFAGADDRLYDCICSSTHLPHVLRALLSDAMNKFVKKHLVVRYGERYNAACVNRRAELEVSFDYLATSLSTILNLSPGIQAGTSMHRSTGGWLVSPASIVELLREVDRAAYPAKSILPTLVPLALPMGRHRSASVPIDPMPDRTASPQDDHPAGGERPSGDLRTLAVDSFQIHTSAQGELIDIDESDNGSRSGSDNDLYLTLEGGSTYAPTEALRPGPPPSVLSLSTDSLLSISSPASPASPSVSLLSISDTGADWDAQEQEASWDSDSHSHSHSHLLRHKDTQREGDLQEQESSFSTVATNGSLSLPGTLPLNGSPWSAPVAADQQAEGDEGAADEEDDACSVLSVSSFSSE